MKLIDKIVLNYLERKAKKYAGLNPNGVPGNGLVPINSITLQGFSTNDWVSAYENNGDLYAVANFLIRKAASIPWYVYSKKKGTKAKVALERYKQLTKGIGNKGAFEQAIIARKAAYDENAVVDNTSLARRLQRPNENQSQDKFFESCFGYGVLSGESNLWGNTGDATQQDIESEFVELQVLPTQFVSIIPDPRDVYGILGYRLDIGSGQNIAKENLLMAKNFRPSFDASTRIHMRGLSAVQVAWKTYQMADNAATSLATMLKNGGAKGALTPNAINGQPSPILTPEQASAAKMMVNDSFNGNKNAGNIGVLARSYDYLSFGLNAVDMETMKVLELTLHQWCRVLGLPTVIFDTAHSADNNYQNGMRDLVTNTIVPMMASLRDELNRWLLPRFDAEDQFIDFDITALPELQRDMEKMINGLKQAYWLTEDEKRIAMNYEPKGGVYDTSLVPSGLTPIENVGMDISVTPDPNVAY